MKLGKESLHLLRVFNPWKRFEFVLAVLSLLSSCFTVSIVGFLRKDFGERYFSTVNLMFGYTVVAYFAFLGNIIGVATGHHFSWLMVFFWAAFIGVSIFHRLEISRKNKRGEEWHSMNVGTSLLPVPMKEESIYKFIEPALVMTVGLMLWKISGQAGAWLIIGGLSLFVNNHLVFYFQRQALLDIRDARIEARYMSGAIQGKPAKQTGGFVLADSNIQLIRKDAGLQSVLAQAARDMKNMFGDGPVAA